MIARLVRWLGRHIARPRRPAPEDDIAAYI